MDHHCYFMNNCIGSKNYKYFFGYLYFSFINSFGAIVLTLYRFYIFKYLEAENIRRSLKLKILMGFLIKTIMLLLICIPTFLGTAYLLIYHLFLIYKGQTTIERIYPKLFVKDETIEKKSFCERISSRLGYNNFFNIYNLE